MKTKNLIIAGGSLLVLSSVLFNSVALAETTNTNLANTTLTATSTHRDIAGKNKGIGKSSFLKKQKPPMPLIQGNGQPIIGGSVTAINGSTLTVTNKSNVVYTVDASNATVNKARVTSTVSNIVVGDNVIIQGAVNGNSVTASSIIDQGVKVADNPNVDLSGNGKEARSFMGSVGGFFKHLFGF